MVVSWNASILQEPAAKQTNGWPSVSRIGNHYRKTAARGCLIKAPCCWTKPFNQIKQPMAHLDIFKHEFRFDFENYHKIVEQVDIFKHEFRFDFENYQKIVEQVGF